MLGSSLVNTVAGLLSLLAGLASSIVVARLLGVEGAGAVAYALWIMTAATLASDLGIPQALLRFAAQEEGERAGVARALRGSVGISAILPAKRFLA
jgi:O-antigen/teichoic acid export membrane protein